MIRIEQFVERCALCEQVDRLSEGKSESLDVIIMRRWTVCIVVACFAVLSLVSSNLAQTIQPATDAPQPHTPEESLKMFEVEKGFHIELVAAEPLVKDPVAICFDAGGRIYACEIHGYNLDGHFDIQKLNETGELDKQVRRIYAPKWAREKADKLTYGTVNLLIDSDADGIMDRSHVFADGLPPCYGVVPWRDGVVVLCAPHIYFLADRNDDGKAEVREQLFTGLNQGELWSRANHLVWGLDNWIYVCSGRGGGRTITGPHLDQPVTLGGSNLWKDCGDFTLTGIAPTAMGSTVYFDNMRLLSSLEDL